MIGRALLALLAMTGAHAATADAPVVFTNTDEVRACLPLAGGETLVGTSGGLVRLDAAGRARGVWTASDGLPGTRIDAVMADGARVWVGTDRGVAAVASGEAASAEAGTVSDPVVTKPVRGIARWRNAIYRPGMAV